MGVTNFMILSQTSSNVILRTSRIPHGPTLTFRVDRYTLARQVRAAQRKPVETPLAFEQPPLVVLHGFGAAKSDAAPVGTAGISHADAFKMTSTLLQNMFPQIQPASVKLADCRRVVLVHYVKESQQLEFRHYYIRAVPVGVSRVVRRLTAGGATSLSDVGKLRDISEFVLGRGATGVVTSDSEVEDEASKVILPQTIAGVGNTKSQQSAIKLAEIGPRLSLTLLKIEQGLCEGEVLYHSYIHKTKAEAATLKKKASEKVHLKEKRRAVQEANVAKKVATKAAKKEAKEERRKLRQAEALAAAAEGTLGDTADAPPESEGESGSEEEEEERPAAKRRAGGVATPAAATGTSADESSEGEADDEFGDEDSATDDDMSDEEEESGDDDGEVEVEEEEEEEEGGVFAESGEEEIGGEADGANVEAGESADEDLSEDAADESQESESEEEEVAAGAGAVAPPPPAARRYASGDKRPRAATAAAPTPVPTTAAATHTAAVARSEVAAVAPAAARVKAKVKASGKGMQGRILEDMQRKLKEAQAVTAATSAGGILKRKTT